MKSLNELRDELAEQYDHMAECPMSIRERNEIAFRTGFDAAIKSQAEVSSAGEDFDRVAAEQYIEPMLKDDAGYVSTLDVIKFVQGAHWQHSQNRAALSAMKSELSDMQNMQSFGYKESKAEIEKIRAENAMLSEALNQVVFAIRNGDETSTELEMHHLATDALTAADKVRSE